MSPPLFLVASLPPDSSCRLDGPEGHHAADVQRLRPGERLLLCDGHGELAEAEVTAARRGGLDLAIVTRHRVPRPDPRLTVVQALAKGDRGELAVQAMTEVGVDAVVPWRAARAVEQWKAERGERALQRWRATAREAAKQARRAWVPPVTAAESTASVTVRIRDSAAAFVLHEAAGDRLTRVELPARGEITLVVGPEGGVAEAELAAFEAAGARPVRLGPEVLRTSTAGVAALAALAVRLGRW